MMMVGSSGQAGTQICNGTVQVDEILRCCSVPTQLVGSVQIGDERTSFQFSEPEVRRRGLFGCIQQLVPNFNYRPSWNVQSERLAYLLHNPRVRSDAEVVGWR